MTKKHVYFHVISWASSRHAIMKGWGSSFIPESLWIIVERYGYTAQTVAHAQAWAQPWPGSGITSHAYRHDDHITHYEGHW